MNTQKKQEEQTQQPKPEMKGFTPVPQIICPHCNKKPVQFVAYFGGPTCIDCI